MAEVVAELPAEVATEVATELPAESPFKLPVVLIAGYLGAGKTTLVNHLLRHAQGRRVAVLVNDFGSINIDAELIASGAGADSSAGVLSLTGGCLCCSFGDDLVGTLTGLTQRQPPPDVCLIELSGVALPASVARTVRLVQAADVVGTLVVCDAEHIQRQAADCYVGDTVHQQLQQADWLMLNKPDLVTTDVLQATAAWLQHAAPQTRQWAGHVDAVWPELLLGWRDGIAESGSPGVSDTVSAAAFASHPMAPAWGWQRHAPALFESCSFLLPAQTDLHGLGAELAAANSGVLRAKGLLSGQCLQVAGGRWAVTPAPCVPNGHVVLIGLRGHWNPQTLMQRWSACAA